MKVRNILMSVFLVMLAMIVAGSEQQLAAQTRVYVPPYQPMNTATRNYGIMSQQMANAAAAKARTRGTRETAETGEFLRESLRALSAKSGGGSGNAVIGTRTLSSSSATTFRPVADSIMPARLAAQMSDDEQQRTQRADLFAMFVKQYKELVAKQGKPANDVAGAVASFIANNYEIASGTRLPDVQYTAFRQQMNQVFSSDADFQAKDDRQRQEMFETMVIMGTLPRYLDFLATQNNNNQRLRDTARQTARETLEETLGIKLAQMKFTANGLEF